MDAVIMLTMGPDQMVTQPILDVVPFGEFGIYFCIR